MMASSFAFWRFGKLGKRTNWLRGREEGGSCGAMPLPRLPSVAAIFRGRKSVVLSFLPRARLLGPIRRTSVAIRRRRAKSSIAKGFMFHIYAIFIVGAPKRYTLTHQD